MGAALIHPDVVELDGGQSTRDALSAQNDGGNPVVEAGKATGAGAADLDAQLMGYIVGAAGAGDGRPA
jgi:hypothetical protein